MCLAGWAYSRITVVRAPGLTHGLVPRLRPFASTIFAEMTALEFCRELPARVGVAAIPVQVFVDDPAPWRHLVRFTFCKRDDVLDEAIARLTSARR